MVTALMLGFLCAKNVPVWLSLQQLVSQLGLNASCPSPSSPYILVGSFLILMQCAAWILAGIQMPFFSRISFFMLEELKSILQNLPLDLMF